MVKGYKMRHTFKKIYMLNKLKIYIVNFVYFNNICLIKLCQIIMCATNALKA